LRGEDVRVAGVGVAPARTRLQPARQRGVLSCRRRPLRFRSPSRPWWARSGSPGRRPYRHRRTRRI